MTKQMIVGALQESTGNAPSNPTQKFSYDTQSDWELSRLLAVLDDQAKDPEIRKDSKKLAEINRLADACAAVLEKKTESAEAFVQLATRELAKNNFRKIDVLADILASRFPPGEVAEIVRQTDMAQIRAIAYEALAMMPLSQLVSLLDDPIYFEIARNAIEQQAYEFEIEDARQILEQLDLEEGE